MRVLIFGDSIAQGFYDRQGGWADRVRHYFDNKLIDTSDMSQPTVFNLGISGNTTKTLLKRLENEIVARIWPGEEFAFVLATGTNDSIYRPAGNHSEPDIYTKQLNELLAIAQKHSTKIVFVGLFPVVDKLVQPLPWSKSGKSYSTERVKLFDSALRDFCKTNNVPYIDLWNSFEKAPDLNALLFDGVHPNDAGHKLIADLVQPKVKEFAA